MDVNDFATANQVMIEVFAAESNRLDTETKDGLVKVITSPIAPEASAHFVEYVYAHSKKFLKASRTKAADVAAFVTANGFYGFRDNQRGVKIGIFLRGEAVAEAPEVLQQFKQTPVAPVEHSGPSNLFTNPREPS